MLIAETLVELHLQHVSQCDYAIFGSRKKGYRVDSKSPYLVRPRV